MDRNRLTKADLMARTKRKEKKVVKQSKVFLFIGILMVMVAIIFFVFALNHPEMSFNWSNTINYTIYIVYFVVMLAMFILSVVFRKK